MEVLLSEKGILTKLIIDSEVVIMPSVNKVITVHMLQWWCDWLLWVVQHCT
jgi:hypothetical protein